MCDCHILQSLICFFVLQSIISAARISERYFCFYGLKRNQNQQFSKEKILREDLEMDFIKDFFVYTLGHFGSL